MDALEYLWIIRLAELAFLAILFFYHKALTSIAGLSCLLSAILFCILPTAFYSPMKNKSLLHGNRKGLIFISWKLCLMAQTFSKWSWDLICSEAIEQFCVCSFWMDTILMFLCADGSVAAVVAVVLILVVLFASIGIWVYYAYTHPTSASGMWLMEVGTLCTWKRGRLVHSLQLFRRKNITETNNIM